MKIAFNIIFSIIALLFITASTYFIISINSVKDNSYQKRPNFVSAKFNTTNLRSGSGLDYPILHTYNQRNLPLKVIGDTYEWYNVEDIQGKKGWVNKNIVSSQKYAFVLQQENVYLKESNKSKIIAILKPMVIVKINICNQTSSLCSVTFFVEKHNLNYKGWIVRDSLWGDIN